MPGKDGQLYKHTECYTCHSYGHFSDQCPGKKTKAMNIENIGVMLMQTGDVINKTCILLDTCSTDSVTKYLYYVEDVKNCSKEKYLTVLITGGSLLFDGKGRLTFLPLSVHVNDNFLATILSFKYVSNIAVVRVTMDTSIEKAVNMILSDGTVCKVE